MAVNPYQQYSEMMRQAGMSNQAKPASGHNRPRFTGPRGFGSASSVAPSPPTAPVAPNFTFTNTAPAPPPPPPQSSYAVAPALPTLQERRNWDQRVRSATENYAMAEAMAEAQRQEADVNRAANLRNIMRTFLDRNLQTRADAGSAGMAWSPSTMGRLADRLREEQAARQASVQRDYTTSVQRALAAVDQARRLRDRTLDDVAAERAYAGGDHTRLLPRIYG